MKKIELIKFCPFCGSLLESTDNDYKQCLGDNCHEVFLIFINHKQNLTILHLETPFSPTTGKLITK